ncbi:MAG: MBL fold metallo-hydrolase [Clostridiales bacterium]|nr:MBL fold metallo-hydrolase [Clostridiales bacterium]
MIKKIIQKNLWCFQFDAPAENHLGTNIFVLINNSEALLLDAGYKEYLTEVLAELKDYTIKGVLPSHYHPDHIDGIRLMGHPVIYGNVYAEETIKLYMPDDLKLLKPTHIIHDKETLQFGEFTLTFYHAPGHSDCTMLIDINKTYLHVGDLYMTKNSGTDVLPYVIWKNVSKHIESLKTILELGYKNLLLSHGYITIKKDNYSIGINDRITYLENILNSDNTCTTEEALKHTNRPFAFHQWRDDIQKDL